MWVIMPKKILQPNFNDFIVQIKCVISNNMYFILKIINSMFHRNIIRYLIQEIYIDAAGFISAH